MIWFKKNKEEKKVVNNDAVNMAKKSQEDMLRESNQYEYEKFRSFILLVNKLATIKNILLIGSFSSRQQRDLLSDSYDKKYARLLNMFTKLTSEYQLRVKDRCNNPEFGDVSNEDTCNDIIDYYLVEQIISNYKKSRGKNE